MSYKGMELNLIASNVKKIRGKNVLSQEELSEKAGLSIQTISRIERADGCSKKSLTKIARALDLKSESFLEETFKETHNDKVREKTNDVFLSIISYGLNDPNHRDVVEQLRDECGDNIPTSVFALVDRHIKNGIKVRSPAGFLLVCDKPIGNREINALKEYASTNCLYRLNVKPNNTNLNDINFIGESNFYNSRIHIDKLHSILIG